MWFKPRNGVRYLEEFPMTQLWIMVGLCFLYFFQFTAFLLQMDEYTIAPLLTFKGFVLAVYFMLYLALGALITTLAASLAFWAAARCFNGEGTLPQTRAAVVWTFLLSAPLGFFWLMLYFAYSHQGLLGKAAGVVGAVSYIGAIATVIYMLIVLMITLSEINKFRLGRSFLTLVVGAVIFAVIAYALLALFHLMSRG